MAIGPCFSCCRKIVILMLICSLAQAHCSRRCPAQNKPLRASAALPPGGPGFQASYASTRLGFTPGPPHSGRRGYPRPQSGYYVVWVEGGGWFSSISFRYRHHTRRSRGSHFTRRRLLDSHPAIGFQDTPENDFRVGFEPTAMLFGYAP